MKEIRERDLGVLINIPFDEPPVEEKLIAFFVDKNSLYAIVDRSYIHSLSEGMAIIVRTEIDSIEKSVDPIDSSYFNLLHWIGTITMHYFKKYFRSLKRKEDSNAG